MSRKLQWSSLIQCGGRSLDRSLDVLLRVRCRNERSLELRGRQVDPALEHVLEKPAEAERVGSFRGFKVEYLAIREKQCKHRPRPIHAGRDAGFCRCFQQSVLEPCAER